MSNQAGERALADYSAFCSYAFQRLGEFPPPVWYPGFRYLSTERPTVTESDLVELVAGAIFPELFYRCNAFFEGSLALTGPWHLARTVVRAASWHARNSKQVAEIDLLFCLILAFEGGVRYGLEGLLDPQELHFSNDLVQGRRSVVKGPAGGSSLPAPNQSLADTLEHFEGGELDPTEQERKKILWDERPVVREIYQEGVESQDFSIKHQSRSVDDLVQKYRGRLPYGMIALAFVAGVKSLPAEDLIPYLEQSTVPKAREDFEVIGAALRELLTVDDNTDSLAVLANYLADRSGSECVAMAEWSLDPKLAICSPEYLTALMLLALKLNPVEEFEPVASDPFGSGQDGQLLRDWIVQSVELLGDPDKDLKGWARSADLYRIMVENPNYIPALSWHDERGKLVFPNVEQYNQYAQALNVSPPRLDEGRKAYRAVLDGHDLLARQIRAL